MKFFSLNVNGIRAAIKKGLIDFLQDYKDYDFIAFNEVKAQNGQIPESLKDFAKENSYEIIWNDSERKGYAGTGVLTKHKPLKIMFGINDEKDIGDKEGRIITLEYKKFYFINTYVPNSGMSNLKFKNRRLNWNKHFKIFVEELTKKKPIIWTGDMNVARFDYDVYDGETNSQRKKSAGFTDYERFDFKITLEEANLIDVKHHLYPNMKPRDTYTFWSWRGKNMKENGKGWRIDYFIVSSKLKSKLKSMKTLQQYTFSDHCPIILETKRF